MIKYYCDACGQIIEQEWAVQFTATLQNVAEFESGTPRPLHLHQACLKKMVNYLDGTHEKPPKY